MTKKHWIWFSLSAGFNALCLVAAWHFTDTVAVRRNIALWLSPDAAKASKALCPCGDQPRANCACCEHPKPLGDNLKNGVIRPKGQVGDSK